MADDKPKEESPPPEPPPEERPPPSPAAVPPTERQQRLQAEARARGGLTPRGIEAFGRLSPSEQQKAVEKELEKVQAKVKAQPKPPEQLRLPPPRLIERDISKLPLERKPSLADPQIVIPETLTAISPEIQRQAVVVTTPGGAIATEEFQSEKLVGLGQQTPKAKKKSFEKGASRIEKEKPQTFKGIISKEEARDIELKEFPIRGKIVKGIREGQRFIEEKLPEPFRSTIGGASSFISNIGEMAILPERTVEGVVDIFLEPRKALEGISQRASEKGELFVATETLLPFAFQGPSQLAGIKKTKVPISDEFKGKVITKDLIKSIEKETGVALRETGVSLDIRGKPIEGFEAGSIKLPGKKTLTKEEIAFIEGKLQPVDIEKIPDVVELSGIRKDIVILPRGTTGTTKALTTGKEVGKSRIVLETEVPFKKVARGDVFEKILSEPAESFAATPKSVAKTKISPKELRLERTIIEDTPSFVQEGTIIKGKVTARQLPFESGFQSGTTAPKRINLNRLEIEGQKAISTTPSPKGVPFKFVKRFLTKDLKPTTGVFVFGGGKAIRSVVLESPLPPTQAATFITGFSKFSGQPKPKDVIETIQRIRKGFQPMRPTPRVRIKKEKEEEITRIIGEGDDFIKATGRRKDVLKKIRRLEEREPGDLTGTMSKIRKDFVEIFGGSRIATPESLTDIKKPKVQKFKPKKTEPSKKERKETTTRQGQVLIVETITEKPSKQKQKVDVATSQKQQLGRGQRPKQKTEQVQKEKFREEEQVLQKLKAEEDVILKREQVQKQSQLRKQRPLFSTLQRQEELQTQKTKQRQRGFTGQTTKTTTEQVLIPTPIITTTPTQIPRQTQLFGSEIIEEVIPVQTTKTSIGQTTIQKTTTKPPRVPKIRTPPKTKFRPKPKTQKEKLTKKALQEGYNTYIKRGNKYKLANQVPLSKQAALGLGAAIVDRFVNRSFEIRKTGGKVEPRPELKSKWAALRKKFRKSKRNPNTIVEKSLFAIDSIQEKKGIPFTAARLRKAGIIKPKRKRKRK